MSGSNINDPHNRAAKFDEEDEDHVDKMLKKAGCLEHHYKVQECMVEYKDWRKCKTVVKGIQSFKRFRCGQCIPPALCCE